MDLMRSLMMILAVLNKNKAVLLNVCFGYECLATELYG